ncbi:pyridoxal phosphate-dependent aminotransferase [Candidatus Parcubacteria bacterium]|nr:pyridoxal phosphate-dependent aminotransferase [Patescibacteria group bacterium]MCG2694453.1 pyridoxal phosphate-dependent aminotransferase [Candidatus Parcubacteria bacterium]
MISKRILQLEASSTAEINKRVLELRQQGASVISFGIGEPNFNVPQEVKDAVKKAVDENFSKYTAGDGTPELKKAIIEKLKTENNIEYAEKNIIASAGAKQCIYNAFQALLNPGDEVILSTPYWVSYPAQIGLAGGVPVYAATGKDFVLRAEFLEPLISEKTKVIVLNSPNNPTGAVIPKEDLLKIARLAIAKNIFIISDEVYEYFVYGAEHTSIASLSEEIKNRTLTINALSKSFAMTGWRLGYAAGPEEIVAGMKKLQEQSTSNPCGLAQKAATTALNLGKSRVKDVVDDFKDKRDFVCGFLEALGIDFVLPSGAFYVFFDVSKYFKGEINSSVDFCKKLLERSGVALMPGVSFGEDNYVRLSYAVDIKDLEEGMKRIKDYLA